MLTHLNLRQLRGELSPVCSIVTRNITVSTEDGKIKVMNTGYHIQGAGPCGESNQTEELSMDAAAFIDE